VIDPKAWAGKGSASAVTLSKSDGRRTSAARQN